MTPGFLSRTIEGVAELLGKAPSKPTPDDMTPAMVDLLAAKKSPEGRKARKAAILAEREDDHTSNKWRWRRWASIRAGSKGIEGWSAADVWDMGDTDND